jgi:hypothetical protein
VPEEGEEQEGGGAVEDGAQAAHLSVRLLVPVQHLQSFTHSQKCITKAVLTPKIQNVYR